MLRIWAFNDQTDLLLWAQPDTHGWYGIIAILAYLYMRQVACISKTKSYYSLLFIICTTRDGDPRN